MAKVAMGAAKYTICSMYGGGVFLGYLIDYIFSHTAAVTCKTFQSPRKPLLMGFLTHLAFEWSDAGESAVFSGGFKEMLLRPRGAWARDVRRFVGMATQTYPVGHSEHTWQPLPWQVSHHNRGFLKSWRRPPDHDTHTGENRKTQDGTWATSVVFCRDGVVADNVAWTIPPTTRQLSSRWCFIR